MNTEWSTSEYVSIELPPHPVKNNYIFKGGSKIIQPRLLKMTQIFIPGSHTIVLDMV